MTATIRASVDKGNNTAMTIIAPLRICGKKPAFV
jgi:hypothetical protein